MKTKSTRYLGMTGTQIGILAALSFVALLAIGGVGWVLMSMSPTLGETEIQAPVATPISATASPTSQPTVKPTRTTITTPTPTPATVATVVPPGGWVEFQTKGATLWLPDSFVGGDILSHKDKVISQITRLGSYYKNAVASIRKASTDTVLWMIDKTKSKSLVITSVLVRHKTLTNETTLEQYINDYLAEKSKTPTINGTKKLTILGRESRRLIYQELAGTVEYTRIDYFIKDENNFWLVTYFMSADIYFDMLPIAEKSIQTFNLLK